jgi:type IV pilus assembly protein PilE
MIVVAIIGILAAVVVPTYTQYVEQARRSDAKEKLQATAQRLERCYTQYGSYTDPACGIQSDISGGSTIGSADGHYIISAATISSTTFRLQAAPDPSGYQTSDPCGTFTLDHTGGKGSGGSAGDDCWQ